MKDNSMLFSAYCTTKNGFIVRQYYVLYNGLYVQIDIKTSIDFIKDVIKQSPCYAYEDVKKVMLGDLTFDDIKPITYKDYKRIYSGV